jgi:hypothetical protein
VFCQSIDSCRMTEQRVTAIEQMEKWELLTKLVISAAPVVTNAVVLINNKCINIQHLQPRSNCQTTLAGT